MSRAAAFWQNLNETSNHTSYRLKLWTAQVLLGVVGAEDRNRTGTPLFTAQDFKSCASTYFATPARGESSLSRFLRSANLLSAMHALCVSVMT